MLSANTDEFMKTSKDIAEGVDKVILGLKADRLDKILNWHIIPSIGLHLSLIGSCAILAKFASYPNLYLLFCSVGTGVLIAYCFSSWRAQPRVGVLGACAAFATAGAVSAPINLLQTALVLEAAYVLVALLVLISRVDPRELLFAPFYSALMINVSHLSPYGLALFFPVFSLGILALVLVKKITISPGLFAGFLVILAYEVDHRNSAGLFLASVCVFSIVALLVYMTRAVEIVNSNLRNFLSQGLAAVIIFVIIGIYDNEPRSAWIWATALVFFFGSAHLFRGYDGLATSIGWICIAITTAIWVNQDSLPWSGSWDTRLRLVATWAIAEGLFIAGRALRNRFACDLARSLLLGTGGLCLLLADQVSDDLLLYLKNGESGHAPVLAEMLGWNAGALAAALTLALLSALGTSFSYGSTFTTRPVAWWHGLMRPRHAVVARAGFRVLAKWSSSVPLLGPVLKLLQAGSGALRYLKTGAEPFRFADLAVLASTLILGFSLTSLSTAALAAIHVARFGNYDVPQPADLAWISRSVAWTSCAILLYGYGLFRRQSLFILVSTILMFVPLVWYVATSHSTQARELGVLALTAGISIVLCTMVRGGLEGPQKLQIDGDPAGSDRAKQLNCTSEQAQVS